MDDAAGRERDARAALIEELEWLERHGLIAGYSLTPAGDVGEVRLSEPAARLVRDGRQPVLEPGFREAARSGPAAARRWLAQEAEAARLSRSRDRS